MIQVLGIGGEPATGKSSLMKQIMSYLGEGQTFSFGKLKGIQFDEPRVFVFGVYDDGVFSGTDRLSMDVIIDSKAFLEAITKDPKWFGWTVLFEGDRLFNKTFLTFCAGLAEQCHFFVLEVQESEKARRHKFREDTQNETWLKGRATKIRNIVESMKGLICVANNNELQTPDIINKILRRVHNFICRADAN